VKDDFAGIVYMQLFLDRWGAHERSTSWHGIAGARDGQSCIPRVQIYSQNLIDVGWWREVAKEDYVARVVQHLSERLTELAPAGGSVARVRDGTDCSSAGVLDVQAWKSGDELRLRGCTRAFNFFAGYMGRKGNIAGLIDPTVSGPVEKSACRRGVAWADDTRDPILLVRLEHAHSQSNIG